MNKESDSEEEFMVDSIMPEDHSLKFSSTQKSYHDEPQFPFLNRQNKCFETDKRFPVNNQLRLSDKSYKSYKRAQSETTSFRTLSGKMIRLNQHQSFHPIQIQHINSSRDDLCLLNSNRNRKMNNQVISSTSSSVSPVYRYLPTIKLSSVQNRIMDNPSFTFESHSNPTASYRESDSDETYSLESTPECCHLNNDPIITSVILNDDDKRCIISDSLSEPVAKMPFDDSIFQNRFMSFELNRNKSPLSANTTTTSVDDNLLTSIRKPNDNNNIDSIEINTSRHDNKMYNPPPRFSKNYPINNNKPKLIQQSDYFVLNQQSNKLPIKTRRSIPLKRSKSTDLIPIQKKPLKPITSSNTGVSLTLNTVLSLKSTPSIPSSSPTTVISSTSSLMPPTATNANRYSNPTIIDSSSELSTTTTEIEEETMKTIIKSSSSALQSFTIQQQKTQKSCFIPSNSDLRKNNVTNTIQNNNSNNNNGSGGGVTSTKRKHLLQFIIDLLKDGCACVNWINKKNREFVISQPDKLALLWAEYKNNYRMTFDSLARSLRLYYAPKKLERISGKKNHYRILNTSLHDLTQLVVKTTTIPTAVSHSSPKSSSESSVSINS